MTKKPDPTPDEMQLLSRLRTEVKEKERRFQSTFEQAAVGMAYVALDGRWLRVNRKLCSIVGYDKQDLLLRTFRELTYAEDLPNNLDLIAQLLAKDIESFSMEKRYIRKDGSLVWVHLTIAPVYDELKNPLYFFAVTEDISERKELEERLNQQRMAFQAMVENAPDIIARFDRQYRYLYVNPALLKMSGNPLESFIGKTHKESGLPRNYAEKYAHKWKGYIDNTFATKKTQVVEFNFNSPEGPRFFQASITPEFDTNGGVISVLSISHDLTEHKLLEIERAHSLAREQDERAKVETERQRLYNLFMEVPASVAWLDGPEHIYKFANKRYLQFVGNRDLLGQSMRTAVPEFEEQGMQKLLNRVYTTGIASTITDQRITVDRYKDGKIEEGFFNFVCQPVYSADGEVDSILIHAVEITEQVHARERLKASQERLELSQQAGHVGTFEWLIQSDEIVWTSELEALYGLPPGGFEGKYASWYQLIYPEDLPRLKQTLSNAVENRQECSVEFRVIWPDGSAHWLLGKGKVVEYIDGHAARAIGVNIDITERKEVEIRLAKTLEQLKFLADAGKHLGSSIDVQEILVHIVKRAIPIMGDWCRIDLCNTAEEIPSQSISFHKALIPTQQTQFQQKDTPDGDIPLAIAAAYQQRKSTLHFHLATHELHTITHDEQEKKLLQTMGVASAMIIPLTAQNHVHGTITLISSVEQGPYTIDDLNIGEGLAGRIGMAIERAQIHKNLQDLNANLENRVLQRTEDLYLLNSELQRSNQELQEFAYIASHDLQEPLRKIQAFGNLLQDEYPPESDDGKEYLERMRNAATRMRILIDDLLTFSRVSTKRMPFAPISLIIVARDVIDDLQPRIQETQGKIEIDNLPTIEADPRQMYQVLQNLIGNALKFHRPNVTPVINVTATIQASPPEDEIITGLQCVLTVKDNGIGFDTKFLDKMFTVFQRLHTRNEYEGTGIGLAVVRKIVERHGGYVTATSSLGVGSTFIVTLPVSHQRKDVNTL